jgi:pyruvate,water dikinase
MSKSGRTVYFFGQGQADGGNEVRDHIGGKAASLGEMTRAGLPVPPGFTLPIACCADYLRAGNRWPQGLEDQLRAGVKRLEEVVGRPFGRGDDPLLLAVRSGATESMPGMLETLLNVGLTPVCVQGMSQRLQDSLAQRGGRAAFADPWAVLNLAVEAVFASWNSDRAVAYRRHNRLDHLAGTAVTIQAMCPADVSGVLFTAHPANPALEQMLIEAAPGLGEALVHGRVTPDRFVVDRRTLGVIHRQCADPSAHPVLHDPQVAELARLGQRVEQVFGGQCEVTWALAAGQFHLLQAGPIRGLDDAARIEEVRRETIDELRRRADGRRCAWARHNLAEALPAPTPLTWDVQRQFMSGSGGYGLMYQDFGFRPSERVKREGFLDLVAGRIYLNTERHAEFYWSDLPWNYEIDHVQRDPGLAEVMPRKIAFGRAGAWALFKVPGLMRRIAHARKMVAGLRADYDAFFHDKVLPPYLDYVRTERARDLAALTDADLLPELEARTQRVMNGFAREAIKLSFFGDQACADLTAQLEKVFGPEEGPALAGALTAGLESNRTGEANARLADVARGAVSRAHFLEEFGHRAAQEFELAVPRWREDVPTVDALIAGLRSQPAVDPHELHATQKRRREQLEESLPERLRSRGHGRQLAAVLATCTLVRRYTPHRENAKDYWLMGYELLRQVLVEIDRRRGLDGGVFFLHLHELPDLLKGQDFRQVIAARRRRRRDELRLYLPDVIVTDDLETVGRPVEVDNGDRLTGTPVAAGTGTGPVVVVASPDEARGVLPGYVLVCPSTDPGWTPLFPHASALVLERGGVASHAAVVARDLGIPAVLLADATRRLTPGEVVRVEGDRGAVVRVQPAPTEAAAF